MAEVGELGRREDVLLEGRGRLDEAGGRAAVEIGHGREVHRAVDEHGDELVLGAAARRALAGLGRLGAPVARRERHLLGQRRVHVERRPQREEVGLVDDAAPDAEHAVDRLGEEDGAGAASERPFISTLGHEAQSAGTGGSRTYSDRSSLARQEMLRMRTECAARERNWRRLGAVVVLGTMLLRTTVLLDCMGRQRGSTRTEEAVSSLRRPLRGREPTARVE